MVRSRHSNLSVLSSLQVMIDLEFSFFSSRLISLILQRMIMYRTCMSIYSYPVPSSNGLGIINRRRFKTVRFPLTKLLENYSLAHICCFFSEHRSRLNRCTACIKNRTGEEWIFLQRLLLMALLAVELLALSSDFHI